MQDYVPIKDSLLTIQQLALKKSWDEEWKADSDARSAEFYGRKHKGLTTAKEESDFLAQDAVLWEAEKQRRIDAGLYRQPTKAELQSKLDKLTVETTALDTRIKAME